MKRGWDSPRREPRGLPSLAVPAAPEHSGARPTPCTPCLRTSNTTEGTPTLTPPPTPGAPPLSSPQPPPLPPPWPSPLPSFQPPPLLRTAPGRLCPELLRPQQRSGEARARGPATGNSKAATQADRNSPQSSGEGQEQQALAHLQLSTGEPALVTPGTSAHAPALRPTRLTSGCPPDSRSLPPSRYTPGHYTPGHYCSSSHYTSHYVQQPNSPAVSARRGGGGRHQFSTQGAPEPVCPFTASGHVLAPQHGTPHGAAAAALTCSRPGPDGRASPLPPRPPYLQAAPSPPSSLPRGTASRIPRSACRRMQQPPLPWLGDPPRSSFTLPRPRGSRGWCAGGSPGPGPGLQ